MLVRNLAVTIILTSLLSVCIGDGLLSEAKQPCIENISNNYEGYAFIYKGMFDRDLCRSEISELLINSDVKSMDMKTLNMYLLALGDFVGKSDDLNTNKYVSIYETVLDDVDGLDGDYFLSSIGRSKIKDVRLYSMVKTFYNDNNIDKELLVFAAITSCPDIVLGMAIKDLLFFLDQDEHWMIPSNIVDRDVEPYDLQLLCDAIVQGDQMLIKHSRSLLSENSFYYEVYLDSNRRISHLEKIYLLCAFSDDNDLLLSEVEFIEKLYCENRSDQKSSAFSIFLISSIGGVEKYSDIYLQILRGGDEESKALILKSIAESKLITQPIVSEINRIYEEGDFGVDSAQYLFGIVLGNKGIFNARDSYDFTKISGGVNIVDIKIVYDFYNNKENCRDFQLEIVDVETSKTCPAD